MTTDALATVSNPYDADLSPVPFHETDRIRQTATQYLTDRAKVVKRSLGSAKRSGNVVYIGRTITGWHGNFDAKALPIIDYAVMPDGQVIRYQGGTHAHAGMAS